MIDKQASQETISRLRRATSHPLTVDVCDIARALLTERDVLLARVSQLELAVSQGVNHPVSQTVNTVSREPTVSQPTAVNAKRKRTEYMREYMRKNPEKRTKRAKAG